jgi:PhnB protein
MPQTLVQAYLCFNGRCEEALEFYRTAIGAEIDMLMRMKDSPDPAMCPPGSPDKVMHASFRVGETTLMASDGRSDEPQKFDGISLSLSVPDETTAHRFFNALAGGGSVMMPLTKTFYSPCFGMLTDKFGVTWMVIVPRA